MWSIWSWPVAVAVEMITVGVVERVALLRQLQLCLPASIL
jgi:hypothetical protein